MRLLLPVAGAVALLCALATPAHAERLPMRALGASGPLGDERLSDEVKLTRYTRANRRATVWSEPSTDSRKITRLRFYTEDNYTEIYVALESRVVEGEPWVRLRIPMRPNGTKGWVPRWALRDFRVVRTRMVVDRRRLRATLFRNGRRIWQSRVGVGKAGTPTPAGTFWVRERITMDDPGGPYGPFALGTSAYSVLSDWPGGGVVGIHGTNMPSLLPGRVSSGCIRVPNRKIVQLKRLMPVGTPVIVR